MTGTNGGNMNIYNSLDTGSGIGITSMERLVRNIASRKSFLDIYTDVSDGTAKSIGGYKHTDFLI